MSPDYAIHLKMKGTPAPKQSGAGLAMLLFIIVILALLSATLMKINNQSMVSNAHQVISIRAFLAAESGANFQAMRIFPVDPGATSPTCGNENFTFSSTGLVGCTATTQCSSVTVNSEIFYTVISQGQCKSGSEFQSTRTIEIRLHTPY